MKKREWKERAKAAESAAEWWRCWSEACEQQRDVAKREAELARGWAEKSEQENERLRAENRLWVPLKADPLVIDGTTDA